VTTALHQNFLFRPGRRAADLRNRHACGTRFVWIAALPATELSFDPDLVVANLLASWPGAMDDSRARTDWGWKPQYDLGQTADHTLKEILRDHDSASA